MLTTFSDGFDHHHHKNTPFDWDLVSDLFFRALDFSFQVKIGFSKPVILEGSRRLAMKCLNGPNMFHLFRRDSGTFVGAGRTRYYITTRFKLICKLC